VRYDIISVNKKHGKNERKNALSKKIPIFFDFANATMFQLKFIIFELFDTFYVLWKILCEKPLVADNTKSTLKLGI